MNFDFDTGTIDGGLQTLNVSTLPPLGGTAGVLTIIGTGAVTVPKGTTAQEPAAAVAGMFRYNTDLNALEYFNSVTWSVLSVGGGTVTSVAATSNSAALTVSGSPITSSGTIALSLDADLTAIAALASTGFAVRTAADTWAQRSVVGTAGTIVVADGDGVAGDPTITLDTVTQAATGTFVKVTLDTFGRVTGNTAVTTSDITTLVDSTYVNLAGDTMTGNLIMGAGTSITLTDAPVAGTDAANKDYVDALANGVSWKQSVIASTTANIDLATGGLLTVDGITVADGARVLVKDQTDPAENGIYIASTGAWVRSVDMDGTTPVNEINGAAVFVEQGTTLADTAWVQTADVQTVGTDPVVWAQFGGPGSYTAGAGLTLSGNQFSITTPVSTALGGTGLTTAASNGQLLIGNGSGYTLATLTGGTGVTVTNSAGGITLDVDAGDLVTSVAGTANQITASAAVGDITLSIPGNFIAPGSVRATTTLTVDTFTANSVLYATTGGQVLSTAALTDGQFLIGSTGNAPAVGTITGGTGVTVTNGAGSITIAVDGTEMVTSFSGGTTGLTPATASYGNVVLGGVLNPANGGTGVDTSTAANGQLLIGNGTGLDLATLTAGSGIGITNGAGSITLANTGVTSFSLNDSSTAAIYTVTPTTSATGAVAATIALNTQAANLVFAGPSTGVAAEPTFRGLVLDDLSGALQLYTENASTPTAPSATGVNAVAIGSGATASAAGSAAFGAGSDARLVGQKAFANGSFATAGDAQHGVYVLRNQTTDETVTELFLDGASEQIVLPNNSLFVFDILVAGRRTDAVGGGAGYRFVGVAKKDATSGSMTFVGTPSKTVIGETNSPWDAQLSADTTNGAIKVTVSGEAAKDVNWVATVMSTEVTN